MTRGARARQLIVAVLVGLAVASLPFVHSRFGAGHHVAAEHQHPGAPSVGASHDHHAPIGAGPRS